MLKSYEFDNLLLLEANRNYTVLHFIDGNSEIYAYTLKYFETLPALKASFVRIHKSFIVNRHFIKLIKPKPFYCVVLNSGLELPLARRRKIN